MHYLSARAPAETAHHCREQGRSHDSPVATGMGSLLVEVDEDLGVAESTTTCCQLSSPHGALGRLLLAGTSSSSRTASQLQPLR